MFINIAIVGVAPVVDRVRFCGIVLFTLGHRSTRLAEVEKTLAHPVVSFQSSVTRY